MAEFGIPYMGSKSGIARDLIDVLPRGKRFVDLFGGGFAMTHCAILSGKWDNFFYNEINPLLVDLIKKALNGDFNYDKFKPEFVTREKFEELKETDGYVKYIWSFGNSGKNYMFGKDIEEKKNALHDAVVFGFLEKAKKYLPEIIELRGDTVKDRRIFLKKIIKERCDLQQLQQLERLERLQQLERLERLERLEQLEQLERLEINCGSYLDYQYKDGDVVYCDQPYEGTAKYSKEGFNHKEFYEWVWTRPYKVYFSSYSISDERFFKIWSKTKRCTLSASDNSLKKEEILYCNQQDKVFLF